MNTEPVFFKSLLDPEITDLCLNGDGQGGMRAFIDKGLGLEELTFDEPLSEAKTKNWILNELSLIGKTWDAKNPFVDATLLSGHRVHVAFPPLTPQGMLISLRRLARSKNAEKPDSGKIRWAESLFFYENLAQAVRKGDSILISGATGSGKTTLANDLLGEVGQNERIIALEDTPELAPHHPHFLTLLSRPPNADGFGEVTLRMLLKQTLRMRPDRIILGECRGTEVLELLQALNTGHRGAMATLHANAPRDALRRIELLCLLASEGNLAPSSIRELLSLGIQWIAQVKRSLGKRKITELWQMEGREGDTILLRPVLESAPYA